MDANRPSTPKPGHRAGKARARAQGWRVDVAADPNARRKCPADGFSRPPLWSEAALAGPDALEALGALGCRFAPAEGWDLPRFCASRGLADSLAWAIAHADASRPGAAAKAWAAAAACAGALFDADAQLGASPGKRRLDDLEAQAGLACAAATARHGPPPARLLASLRQNSRFAGLRALLERARLDRRLAQRLCDIRPEPRRASLADALAPRDPRAEIHQAAKAGAALAPWSPKVDLSLDAESLCPALCAFGIAAGGRPATASRPPLAALCEAAAKSSQPAPAWLFMQALGAGSEAEPPEALCARMLMDLGCSSSERVPGRPSALGVCSRALARQRATARSKAAKAHAARMAPIASWLLQQASRPRGPSGPSGPEQDFPMDPLARLLRAQAEREALRKSSAPRRREHAAAPAAAAARKRL